jgi:hypothetical protein
MILFENQGVEFSTYLPMVIFPADFPAALANVEFTVFICPRVGDNT